ncbi:hypothetical protein [Microcoleus sp. AT3-D2]|uniref:hypothetical protein n=1 Tax=Microcoleus sp. AT3-D2 TaxID=2818612 RepID=UPI002FCF65D7
MRIFSRIQPTLAMRRGFQPPAGCVTKQTNFQSVSGRSNLREMCDRVFVLIGAIGFLALWAIGFFVDRAIEFERNVRSGNKLFTNK